MNRDKIKRILINIFLFSIIYSCTVEGDISTEIEKLMLTDRQFSETSLKFGASEAFNRYLDGDARLLPSGEIPIFGRDAIYKKLSTSLQNIKLQWKPMRAEVAQSRELGWTWGKYTLEKQLPSGEHVLSYGKYLNIWKKQIDGKWKVLVDIGNQSPPPVEQSKEGDS